MMGWMTMRRLALLGALGWGPLGWGVRGWGVLGASPAGSVAAAQAPADDDITIGAQDESARLDEEARGLFLAGRAAFEGGRYEEALGHFERAWELSDRPGLLFNIGHTAQLLGDLPRAIEAFEAYLEALPDVENRAAVAARIERLREQVARAAALEAQAQEDDDDAPAAAPATADAPPSDGPSRAGPIALLATGGAALVGGGLALGLAASSASAVNDAAPGTPWSDVSDDAGAADRRRVAGLVTLGLGAAALAAGVVWWVRGDEDDPAAVALGLVPAPGGLGLEGRF